MVHEKWKDIQDFPGYQVSNTGKVRTNRNSGFGANSFKTTYKVMKPTINRKGYEQVNLWKDGKPFRRMVHRLVLIAFGRRKNIKNLEVDHKDTNKRNNHISNLEWVTSKENTKRAIEKGLCKNNHRFTIEEILKGSNARKKAVISIDLETGKKQTFGSLAEAAKILGLSVTNISSVLRGRQQTTSHYTFDYLGGDDK